MPRATAAGAFYASEYQAPGLLAYPRAERDVNVLFEAAAASCGIATVDLILPDLAGLRALTAIVNKLLRTPGRALGAA